MTKLTTILGALLASSALYSAALAQDATPLTPGEVVGDWTLAITPDERRGVSVTVEARDGGEPDLPLTITARAGGRIACVLRGDPAECRMDDGKLVVTMPTRSGSARMIFTLTDRTRGGFSGTARIRARLLPLIGGHLGSVTMTRR